jgi:O-Antigen ligase
MVQWWVLYPLLIPFISSLYRQEHSLSIYRILLACAWIIAVIDLLYVIVTPMYPGNALQRILKFLYEDWAVVDDADTYIKFTLPNVSSVIFLLPFFLSVLFFRESRKGIVNILVVVLLLFSVAMLSGRRALLLTMLLGPAIAFLITLNASRNNVRPKNSRRPWMLLITVLALSFLTYISVKVNGLEYYFDLVSSVFDFTSNQSNLERVYQFDALMRGIVEAPLFGHGAGAVADYLRSDEMPWAYELFFLSIIFQYGIFGFLLYALGVAFICLHLISSVKNKGRSSFEFYFLSGFIAFMAATASNPYLGKFDYMWVLFIPYAIINLKFVSTKKMESAGIFRAY